MIKLDLTVLLFDSLTARIYLAMLEKYGYKPSKIILLHKSRDSVGWKHSLVQRALGKKYAARVSSIYTKLYQYKLFDIFSKNILSKQGLSIRDINNCLKKYKPSDIAELTVKNLDDDTLIAYIEKNVHGPILFTGGGILKNKILSIPTVKFIHIHPGIVPDIRGADCLFWSYLLNGKAGYSVFYMNEGIDTGDILHKKEFDIKLKNMNANNQSNLYKSILSYYDPCLRIKTFIEILDKQAKMSKNNDSTIDLMNLPFEKQDSSHGRMYFFMHKELRDFVISKLI